MALPLLGNGGLNNWITSFFLIEDETDWPLANGKQVGDPDVGWTLAVNEDETDWTLAKNDCIHKEKVDWTLA